ncbi:hypothetical protein [Hyperthermus butylicus]|uniref:Uncharacterized protein n=1 Tax=Hyperthermus butylicus (strain DSM 5456 / JCM 9403 / PLM1-5) TaxID=415426 RepID=A2BL05_HYPBU|nr:hypothetical protein [Hyperthermus butylicus]ABM80666.1 hypothetical protein Hbut_0813 [Hyperthermus butylicus DSM 5456]
MKHPRGRRLYIILAFALVAVAAARYAVLVHTASSSLAGFFGNGFCDPGSCAFYIETKGILKSLDIRFSSECVKAHMPGYGVPVDEYLEAKLWRLNSSTYRIVVKTTPHTYLDYVVETSPCTRPRGNPVQLVYTRGLMVRARTVAPVELEDVVPTAWYAYTILVSFNGSCSLSIKLYAFQDRVAWETVREGQTNTSTLLVPAGGALDVEGYGPEYTKLVLVNYSDTNCTATVRVYRVPAVKVGAVFEDYNVTLSLPLLTGLPAGR